jgi:hypothetical protein
MSVDPVRDRLAGAGAPLALLVPGAPRVDATYTELPWKHHVFPMRSRSPADALPVGPFVDSVRGLDFVPITLHLGNVGPNATDFGPDSLTGDTPLGGYVPLPLTAATQVGGGTVLQIRAQLGEGSVRFYRFALADWRTESFDLTPYVDVKVEIVRDTIVNHAIYAVVTNRPLSIVQADPLFYGEQYPAGTFAVPPCADQLTAGVADAAFLFFTPSAGGAALTSTAPVALALGTTVDVRGTHFTCSVPFLATWRIRR